MMCTVTEYKFVRYRWEWICVSSTDFFIGC